MMAEGGGGGMGGRVGGGEGGGRDYIATLHHQNDSCIKMGSDERHLHVS